MYNLNRLESYFSSYLYSQFTYKYYFSKLKNLTQDSKTVAIGASISENPVGLVLGEIQKNKSAKILSIYVMPQYRHQGIATALLTSLEEELVTRGCTSIEIIYMTGKSTTVAIENLLKNFNWDVSKPRMLFCKTRYDDMLNASWMKLSKLPAKYEIFPWQEITDKEREEILQSQEIEPWIPSDLIPFKYEENLEPLNSFGLRYQGKVVGWLITHRHDKDTIRYTCSYVRPDLQKRGRILPLYIKATKVQVKHRIPFGMWTVPLQHQSMVNFVKKYMKPYMISLEYTMGASKLLSHSKTMNDLILRV